MQRLQRRVRLTDCHLDRAGSRLRAQVRLEEGGEPVTGAAERPDGPDADLWCAAEATVAALRQIVDLGTAGLALKDVVTLEISDGPGVAVALQADLNGGRRRLFGLTQAEADRARSAAKAVLSATNRFFGSC